MSRYIDADKIEYAPCTVYQYNGKDVTEMITYKKLIDIMPTADVEKVRHGEWTKYQSDGKFGDSCVCSNCHKSPTAVGVEFFKYCPYCGAKMDGGKK